MNVQNTIVVNSNLGALNNSGAIKGMDAREDGVYITYSTGADTVTKKLGSNRIHMSQLECHGQGNMGSHYVFLLDGQTKLSIASIMFMSSNTLQISKDDTTIATYNSNVSNINLDISGASKVTIHYEGWVGNNAYGKTDISDLIIE